MVFCCFFFCMIYCFFFSCFVFGFGKNRRGRDRDRDRRSEAVCCWKIFVLWMILWLKFWMCWLVFFLVVVLVILLGVIIVECNLMLVFWTEDRRIRRDRRCYLVLIECEVNLIIVVLDFFVCFEVYCMLSICFVNVKCLLILMFVGVVNWCWVCDYLIFEVTVNRWVDILEIWVIVKIN